MPPTVTSSGRSYTSAQEDAVRRIFACDASAHYAVLNVKEDADVEEIIRAFTSLALLLHPDKNAAARAEEAFNILQRAWQVLSDVQQRAAYDNERRGDASGFSASSTTHGPAGGSSSLARPSPAPPPKPQKPPQQQQYPEVGRYAGLSTVIFQVIILFLFLVVVVVALLLFLYALYEGTKLLFVLTYLLFTETFGQIVLGIVCIIMTGLYFLLV